MNIPRYDIPSPVLPVRIGTGGLPVASNEGRFATDGLSVTFSLADIRNATDWVIHDNRDTVILHLAGKMEVLETELEGHGGSFGSANQGEIWTVPAGRRYQSFARGDQILYAVIQVEILPDSLESAGELTPLAGTRDQILLNAITQLREVVIDQSDAARLRAETVMHHIRSHIIKHHFEPTVKNTQRHVPPLSKTQCRWIREYIHDNLGGPITLADLSGLLHRTPHHFLIAFRQSFQTTPAQYIIQQRIRAAQRALLQSPKDITSIALDSGFSSHSHFSSVFQQRMGLTPSEFRLEWSSRHEYRTA